MTSNLKENALNYHRYPRPGKIKITPTKALTTQQDLALAYSPGVAAASELIHDDPSTVSEVTARGNLVAVISNGTAVLGLGDIGPLASKPVMEGKGVLFKKFADIDVFDLEIDESDPDRLVDIIAALEPTFGGVNLEDIKAPECFIVESKLKERLSIPVFHDDQHGTAIITAAAVRNALKITGKSIDSVRLVASGAGAAGIACLDLLVGLGLKKENIVVVDREGVIYAGRESYMDDRKAGYAADTEWRTLEEAIAGADIFLGVSAGGVLSQDMVASMADSPVILALANPDPEILPELAREVSPDAIIATGRSDYPNQVNNVLCFPYIFRGALDVGASGINEAMKLAAVEAIAELAQKEVQQAGVMSYSMEQLQFGQDYIIPKPFDPRLLVQVAPAVARAAMESGMATRPLEDLDAYREKLEQFVYRTGLLMKPVFDAARAEPRRVAYANGEEPIVLRAVQTVVDNRMARPILIGRPAVVESRLEKLGMRLRPGEDFELVNPESDPRFWDYWTTYHAIMERRGVSPDTAKAIVRTRNSVIAALMVHRGEADAMITGIVGRYRDNLTHVLDVIGLQPGIQTAGSLGVLSTDEGACFVCDTHVNPDPSAEQIAEITLMAADKIRIFGIRPRVALLSHSAFGSHEDKSASKMRRALELLHEQDPNLEAEGEMTADMALDETYRRHVFPNSRLSGPANLLVMPNLDSAHIAFNFARMISNGVTVGPILLGARQPAHVLTPSASARRLVNMTALAVVEAQLMEKQAIVGSAGKEKAG
ncbi:NADP-dependent malic enzyme [Elongatibacter sediminis]|uniref:NADP-dependent malic enzyme n=1 Tax=Elongatibacter sediminis TaxID=3119006 RepID=A0AAW9RQC0_9GAMM